MNEQHQVTFCELCERDVVLCKKCGNNTCNGGYGTLPNGETCDECSSAYEQDRAMSATPI